MLFNLTHENREEPRMLSIHEHDSVTLVLVQNLHQRRDVRRFIPARVVSNRYLDLARPEKLLRLITKKDDALRSRLHPRNVLSHSLGVSREVSQLLFIQSLFDSCSICSSDALK